MYIKGKSRLGEDKGLLRANIRMWAHWLDKYRTYCPRPLKEIRKNLKFLINLFNKHFAQQPPDVQWASYLLDGHTSLGGANRPKLNTSFLSVIKGRRSVRKWRDKPVSEDRLRSIIKIGLAAPSSANMQSVRILICKTLDDIEFILRKTGHRFSSRPAAILVLGVDTRLYTANGKIRQPQDVAVVGQNILLGATYHQLGSCYMSNKAFNKPSIKSRFSIPGYIHLYAGICLGYPSKWPIEVPKLSVDECLL